jgi:hypothetical protein
VREVARARHQALANTHQVLTTKTNRLSYPQHLAMFSSISVERTGWHKLLINQELILKSTNGFIQWESTKPSPVGGKRWMAFESTLGKYRIEAGMSFGTRENTVESVEPINELEDQRDAWTKRRAQVLDFSTYPLPFDQIGAITPCLWHRLPDDAGSKTRPTAQLGSPGHGFQPPIKPGFSVLPVTGCKGRGHSCSQHRVTSALSYPALHPL